MRDLLRNRYLWFGLGGLFLICLVLYVLFDSVLMPAYTRHDVTVEVPSVRELPFEEASELIDDRGLRVEQEVQRYNPSYPKGVVVDQNPPPNVQVKPGRRVYLYVNSGEIPEVEVPNLNNISLRQARSQLHTRGLEVGEVQNDSIPSPYKDTVTRQDPAPGTKVPEGTPVNLWISVGLGETQVLVPDVLGLSVEEAQNMLLDAHLRYVVLNDSTLEGEGVARQSPEPGTRVREGHEVRIYTREE